jgi:hypothetical protein
MSPLRRLGRSQSPSERCIEEESRCTVCMCVHVLSLKVQSWLPLFTDAENNYLLATTGRRATRGKSCVLINCKLMRPAWICYKFLSNSGKSQSTVVRIRWRETRKTRNYLLSLLRYKEMNDDKMDKQKIKETRKGRNVWKKLEGRTKVNESISRKGEGRIKGWRTN